MKANIKTAKRGAIDLLKCINELQELIPQLLEKYTELESRVHHLEDTINNDN